jgi:endonuclease YncB( thermonuclease family)
MDPAFPVEECMRGPYQILLPLLGLILVRVDLTDLFPLFIPVEVLKIYDGDTLLVGHGSYQMKLRLGKIDSPEKGQPSIGEARDAGALSRDCLMREIEKIKHHVMKVEKEDIYGRVLGDIDNLSLVLIEKGCTTLYPYAQFDSRQEKTIFLNALKMAKASRRGLWQYGGFRQPKLWRKASKRIARRQWRR